MFRINPITVLEADTAEWLVLVASANVIAEDKRKEAERQKAQSRIGGASRSRGRRKR